MSNKERERIKAILSHRRKETEVADKVIEHYKFDLAKSNLITKFFFEGKSITATCLSVGICRTTFFKWMNEILELAYLWAKELKYDTD